VLYTKIPKAVSAAQGYKGANEESALSGIDIMRESKGGKKVSCGKKKKRQKAETIILRTDLRDRRSEKGEKKK